MCVCRIIGWDESPNSGDQFVEVKNQKEAKAKAEENKTLLKEFDSSAYTVQSRVSEMMQLLQEGELNTINIILKADTNGSVEAIRVRQQRCSGRSSCPRHGG